MLHAPRLTYEQLIAEFLNHFREYKVLKQKAFYLGESAGLYYDFQAEKIKDFVQYEKRYYSFIQKYCLEKEKKIALISLGCGNARKEKAIMASLEEDGYSFAFFGVDSSPDMIALAEDVLEGETYPYTLFCADFSSDEFLEQLHTAVKTYDIRVYSFLGATFGNVQQSYMADILSDMLEPGDTLWLEVAVRQGTTLTDDRRLFEKYLSWLDSEKHVTFLQKPLHDFQIPIDHGELFVEMKREDVLGALCFVFGFRFLKKTVISFLGHTITLLPGTMVELLTIRAYDGDGLVRFFEERDFRFVASERGLHGQFLFERTTEKRTS